MLQLYYNCTLQVSWKEELKLLGLSKDYLPGRKVIDCANLRNCETKRTRTSTYPTIKSDTEKGIQLNGTL